MKCKNCNNELKLKSITRGYTLCYSCNFLEKHGREKWIENNQRLANVKLNRERRNQWRTKRFECEMGYVSCESRGYCNGDC